MADRSASAASKSSTTMPTWNWVLGPHLPGHRFRAVYHAHARTALSHSEKAALTAQRGPASPGESRPDLEDRRGRRHHAVVVALVVEGHWPVNRGSRRSA